MTTAAINATALKTFIARIERLEAEKAALSEDIKVIYAEAKASGYSPKIMRQVVKRRTQDPDKLAAQEAELELYVDAVGFGSLPLGKVAAAAEPSHDPETGEILEPPESRSGANVQRQGVASGERPAQNAPRPSKRAVSTNDEPSPGVGPQAEASLAGTGSGTPADREGHISEGAAHTDEAVTVDRHVSAAPPPDDDLELPAYLDRREKVLEHA